MREFKTGDVAIYHYGSGNFERVEILKKNPNFTYKIRYCQRFGSREDNIQLERLLTKEEAQAKFNKWLSSSCP
jgi:hypothetical protein